MGEIVVQQVVMLQVVVEEVVVLQLVVRETVVQQIVMSVPGSRETPRDEENHRYFNFKQLRHCVHIESSHSFVSVVCCGHS